MSVRVSVMCCGSAYSSSRVDFWEVWIYGDDSSQSQSSIGDLGISLRLRGRVVRICVREVSLTLVCGSVCENGCVVDGICATAVD